MADKVDVTIRFKSKSAANRFLEHTFGTTVDGLMNAETYPGGELELVVDGEVRETLPVEATRTEVKARMRSSRTILRAVGNADW